MFNKHLNKERWFYIVTKLNKNSTVYFVKISPNPELTDIYDLHIRTVADDYYVGLDSTTTKHAYIFSDRDINETIFINKADALEKLMGIKGEYDGN